MDCHRSRDVDRRRFLQQTTAAALLAGLPTRVPAQTEAIPEELLAATRVSGPEQPVIGELNGIPFTGAPRSIPGLDEVITKIMTETGIPGFSFAVSRYVNRRSRNAPWGANELKFVRGYGYANVEDQVPLTGLVPQFAGSISKVITAMACCRAHDDGMLGLDEPAFKKAGWTKLPARPGDHYDDRVQRLLDAPFDERWYKVTPAHVVSHSSCTPEFPDNASPKSAEEAAELTRPENLIRGQIDLERSLHYSLRIPLDGEPGTQCQYRGRGVDMLAFILGEVTGKSHVDWIRGRLMQPLGITGAYVNSEFLEPMHVDQVRSYGYRRNGQHERVTYRNPCHLQGGGSGAWMLPMVGLCRLVSYYRYLLKPATFQRMFERPAWLVKLGREAAGDRWWHYYGLGWNQNRARHNDRLQDFGHNGMVGGARSDCGWKEGGSFVYAAAANTDWGDGYIRLLDMVQVLANEHNAKGWPAHDLWPEYGFSEPELAFPQEVQG